MTEKQYTIGIKATTLLMLFLVVLLIATFSSCNTVKKFANSEQNKTEAQENTEVEQQTQTKSIAFDGSKINLVYNHATPQANILTYNVTTGEIKAGGLLGVGIETKKIIEKQTVNYLRYVHKTKAVTIHETKTVYKSKGLPWYVKALLFFGSISIIGHLVQLYFWMRSKTKILPL